MYEAIHDGDPTPDLLAIKYLETLQAVANGQATKIIVPTELSGLAGAVGAVAEVMRAVDGAGGTAAGAAAPA